VDVLAAGGSSVTPREVVEALGLRRPVGGRPRVVAAMIASADGRATVAGRSVGLGHPEDRGLLRELRTGADAVLAGAATLRAERYRRLLDPEQAERRRRAGLAEHPVVATVSRRGELCAADVPLFGEPGVPVAVYTQSGAPRLRGATADVTVHELGEGRVDFPAVLASLHRDHGVHGVACEGGPALLRELIAQGCLDDLLLTVAPLLVAGAGPTALAGPALEPPARLQLRDVHRADDHLFLHYAVAR
jgi:riboflavin biosynthesis pyrimidine reductase